VKKSWVMLGTLLCLCAAPRAKIKAVILTGGHGYDSATFNAMWRSFPDVEFTLRPQSVGHEIFTDVSRWEYDVLVFYNHQNPGAQFTKKHQDNLLSLINKGVGIFVMHHAVAAYPFWPEFEKIAGGKYRSGNYYQDTLSTFKIGVNIVCDVQRAEDPIVARLPATFAVFDEGYSRMTFAADNRLLLKTVNAYADGPLAWTRNYGNARVFTTVLGHGPDGHTGPAIFADPNYRAMVHQAVQWVAPVPTSTAGRWLLPRPDVIPQARGFFIHRFLAPSLPVSGWRDARGRSLAP
jgi:uncharacterized protein